MAWRDSPEVLAGLLRGHGLDPDRVDDVAAAWQGFREFLALPVDGLEPPENDADGFLVQWGRYSWNDRLPGLSFTRQFAVDVRDVWADTDWYQPECWQVSLDMVFPDGPALADLSWLGEQDTEWDFSPAGAERDRAIDAVERRIKRRPAMRALWARVPSRSAVTLDCAD